MELINYSKSTGATLQPPARLAIPSINFSAKPFNPRFVPALLIVANAVISAGNTFLVKVKEFNFVISQNIIKYINITW